MTPLMTYLVRLRQVFAIGRLASIVPSTVSLEHVPFGLVQGEDGKKFKTRSGDTGVYPRFTCFTSAKVQILTLTRLPDVAKLLKPRCLQPRSLLALLVQKYKY